MLFLNHTDILDGRAVLVEISGQMDGGSSPDFEDYINETISRNILFMIFDAKSLEYVTSEGIGALILVQKKIININGFFVIINLSDEIRSLFSILGFEKIFNFSVSRIEAMQLIDRHIELRENRAVVQKDEPAADDEIKHNPIPDKQSSELNDAPAGSSLIIECIKCKSLIRIQEPGDFLCPDCSEKFSVNKDMAVSFSQL